MNQFISYDLIGNSLINESFIKMSNGQHDVSIMFKNDNEYKKTFNYLVESLSTNLDVKKEYVLKLIDNSARPNLKMLTIFLNKCLINLSFLNKFYIVNGDLGYEGKHEISLLSWYTANLLRKLNSSSEVEVHVTSSIQVVDRNEIVTNSQLELPLNLPDPISKVKIEDHALNNYITSLNDSNISTNTTCRSTYNLELRLIKNTKNFFNSFFDGIKRFTNNDLILSDTFLFLVRNNFARELFNFSAIESTLSVNNRPNVSSFINANLETIIVPKDKVNNISVTDIKWLLDSYLNKYEECIKTKLPG